MSITSAHSSSAGTAFWCSSSYTALGMASFPKSSFRTDILPSPRNAIRVVVSLTTLKRPFPQGS